MLAGLGGREQGGRSGVPSGRRLVAGVVVPHPRVDQNGGMGDEYTVGNEDGLTPSQTAVRNAIARELYAELPLRNQTIKWEDISGVAYAITVHLDRMRLIGASGTERQPDCGGTLWRAPTPAQGGAG